jgi:flagellin
LSQTGEGALGKVGDSLQRMRELAVQSANGSNSAEDRINQDAEYQQLALEVTRVLEGTEFNGQKLFDATGGDGSGTFTFQVGANNTTTDQIDIDLSTDLTAATEITDVTSGDLLSLANAQTAIDNLDAAIDEVTTNRATFGAVQNRFDSVIANLQVASENQSAARGRIMDADFATETSNLSRGQILQQAGTAMIAQANQLPQGVLSLLQ